MRSVLGDPVVATFQYNPTDGVVLGARIEIPETRAIVSYWQPGVRSGLDWTVTLESPLSLGEYDLVWRTNDAEDPNPEFERWIPLAIVATSAEASVTDFPQLDEESIRPETADVAILERTRIIEAGGGEGDDFTDTTRPTAAEVEQLIDQAMFAFTGNLPSLYVDPRYYDRMRHAVSLYAAVLVESSFFREQAGNAEVVDRYQGMYDTISAGLFSAVEADNAQGSFTGGSVIF